MKTQLLSALALFFATALLGQSADPSVDFNKARQLIEKQRGGGTLTTEENAYLQRARAEREARTPGRESKEQQAQGRMTSTGPRPSSCSSVSSGARS